LTIESQTLAQGTVYSYTVPSGGYDGAGNLLSYTDSINGTWSMASSAGGSGYDSLNRLSLAVQTPVNGTASQSYCWSYDSFGNRTTQAIASGGASQLFTNAAGAAACATSATLLGNTWSNYSSSNQVTSTNARGVTATPIYDLAGNVTYDGVNYYSYDAEGRVCAMQSTSILGVSAYGYIYDADGTRIAKGAITPSPNPVTQPLSCDPTANGFQFTENYVLGPGGEELTMLDDNNNWQRTNVYAAGKLLATYDTAGLHFHLTDPLGTRRMQLSGNLATLGQPETDIQSLPFGDGLNSFADQYAPPTADDSTPLYFTSKERDTESGNDYFGARYYGSSMGRMLSPDSGVDQHPEDPQSWNLYSYVGNNPLVRTDPTGEFTCDSKTVSATQCENAHASDDKAGAALGAIKDKYGADSSQYKDAFRAHEQLGGMKDNGVVLSIGNAGKDSEGKVTIGPMQAKTDDNLNGQNIKVTLGAGDFDGSAGAATSIEHKGFHVADAHDWINTGFNPSAAPNWYQSEFHAYSVQFNLMTAMGITGHPLNGVGIVGAGAPDSQNFQGFMIHAILRQSPYYMDPSSKLTMWQKNTQGGN
jgi:RHS repeat-associated protein